MKTNNKLNKIRSKAKDVCVWIVIGLVIGCIVGWSTHTAIYNITHKEPEVSVGYVTGKLENIGSKEKVDAVCTICGYRWNPRADHLMERCWCPSCKKHLNL